VRRSAVMRLSNCSHTNPGWVVGRWLGSSGAGIVWEDWTPKARWCCARNCVHQTLREKRIFVLYLSSQDFYYTRERKQGHEFGVNENEWLVNRKLILRQFWMVSPFWLSKHSTASNAKTLQHDPHFYNYLWMTMLPCCDLNIWQKRGIDSPRRSSRCILAGDIK